MTTELYGVSIDKYSNAEVLSDRLNKFGFKPGDDSFPFQGPEFWYGYDGDDDYLIALYNGKEWLQVYYEYDSWRSLSHGFNPAGVSGWTRLGRTDIDPGGNLLDDMVRDSEEAGLYEQQSGMAEFDSGAKRSSAEGKPKFGYLLVPGMPYDRQMIARTANRMEEGAVLYGEHNYQKMNTEEELQRAKESLLRHTIQYVLGDTTEDHLAGVDANTQICNSIEYNIEQRGAQ